MGRSAKFHKRQNKKTTSGAGSTTALAPPAPKPQAAAPKEQKKHAGLKAKAAAAGKQRREGDGPVLGGADYVELMFGSRRSARAEAAKLPKDPES